MYSSRIVQQRLEQLIPKLGFEPEYHSVEKVIRANRHFMELVDPETGKNRRKFKSDEIRWIQNERALCQADFRYWVTRYAFIRDMENRLVRFCPNVAQEIFFDICGSLEEAGRAIALMVLKARQLGISTAAELIIGHRVQFYPQTNAVNGSSDPDKSRLMAQMVELCWSHQPTWLMPALTKHKDGELIEFGRQNSALTIQHGTQMSGIARGTTPTAAHLSEVCDYANPKELIDASLLKAMHESPWMFLVLESTAAGRHNWWHDTWEASKEGWKDRTSKLCPIFLPWFVGRDKYPTGTWMNARPIPVAWKPSDKTEAHARRAQEFVQSNELLRKYLGTSWKMPREQMWFWEVERTQAERKKALSDFYSEMPADDTEAFQSKNKSVFDVQIISDSRENTRIPKGVYAVVGADVPDRLRPMRREIDENKKPVIVSAPMANNRRFQAELIPVKFNGFSGFDYSNRLFVWEWPIEGQEYGLGVDTADGIDKDRTVVEVFKKGTIERNDVQVAEWASPVVNSYDLPPIAYAIASLYSTKVLGEQRQSKVVIECNRNGDATQLEMRKMGWSNFHRWQRYDNKKLKQKNSNKLGWFTTAWSRTMVLDLFVKMVRDDLIDINSPLLVDEMADLEAEEDRMRLAAAYGGHDDRIMATAIILFSMHALELNGTQRNLMRARVEERQAPVHYPEYQPPLQDMEITEEHSVYSSAMYQEEEILEEPFTVDYGR